MNGDAVCSTGGDDWDMAIVNWLLDTVLKPAVGFTALSHSLLHSFILWCTLSFSAALFHSLLHSLIRNPCLILVLLPATIPKIGLLLWRWVATPSATGRMAM